MLMTIFNNADAPPPSDAPHTVIIAVDGPAASGKGTLAKALAAQLGYAYLDTGAVYRNVALAVLKAGGDPAVAADVQAVLPTFRQNLTPDMLTDPALRTPEVAEAAALVAAMPEVRTVVRDYQSDFAKSPPGGAPGVVLDGRDIGTVVCPGADIKFFVTAAPEERARRRFEEFKTRTPGITFETVLQEINDRDHHDMSRSISPLKAAADAHILDTTSLNPAQALAAAMVVVRSKISPEDPGAPSGGKPGAKPKL